jgi:Protein of unknown function (DUF4242)
MPCRPWWATLWQPKRFEKAWLDPEAGKVFCLATGPSKESVLRIHERAGHPTNEIYEVPVEVE